MKRQLLRYGAVLGISVAMASVGLAQTTTARRTPTISGFSSSPVSGFTARPVTGFTPAPIQGLAPTPVFPRTTNFTSGPISPLTTTVGGLGTNPIIAPPVVPPMPVAPFRTNVPNAVGTPLF